MPEPATAEQRLAAFFEEKGLDAMDGAAPAEDRVPDVQAVPAPAGPAEGETNETEENEGSADPGVGDEEESSSSDDESVTDEPGEGSQDQEGIETGVLASVLGIEEEGIAVDDEGRPLFHVKVDGEGRTVSIPELLRGYSGQEVFTQKSQQLAEERQQFEVQKQQEFQTFTTKAQAVDRILEEHQQEILDQYSKVDWDKLRQDQPHEFAARRTEYAEVYQKLGNRREAIQQEVLQEQQRAQQEFFSKRNEYAREEGRKLRAAVKDWDTDEKAAQGAKAIETFLTETYGFSGQDVADTLDHRAYLVALDAMKWRLQQKQEPLTRQRLVKVPKVLKPGVPTSAGDKRRVQAAKVANRHRKEKSVNSAAEALLAKGIV